MCLLVNEKRGGGKMSESPILSVKNLKTYFDVTKGVFAKKQIVILFLVPFSVIYARNKTALRLFVVYLKSVSFAVILAQAEVFKLTEVCVRYFGKIQLTVFPGCQTFG